MPKLKSRWGLFLFLASPLFAGGALYISLKYPVVSNAGFYGGVVPGLGVVFSIISFFIGHFSYPRVHNLKVYLIGYLMGLFGLGYFLFFRSPFHFPLPVAPDGYIPSLYMLIGGNLLLVLLVPSFVKYRTAKHFVLSLLSVECVVLLVVRFSPSALSWMHGVDFRSWLDPACLLGVLFLLLAVLVSAWRIKDEFYLGGIFGGVAFLFTVSWISRMYFVPPNPVETLLFAAAPLYLEACILVHWFARMEHRIAYDPLLHIYNRDYCSKIISEQSNLNLTPPLCVAMVDIDHFKSVNDTHGHQAGDQVLYTVAQTICREIVPEGVVCRYGGEEIVVFFPQKDIAKTAPLVENMRQAIEKTKTKTAKKTLGVTVSCGISCREEAAQNIIDVIQAADKALYKAKEGGRNQVKMGKTSSAAVRKK